MVDGCLHKADRRVLAAAATCTAWPGFLAGTGTLGKILYRYHSIGSASAATGKSRLETQQEQQHQYIGQPGEPCDEAVQPECHVLPESL